MDKQLKYLHHRIARANGETNEHYYYVFSSRVHSQLWGALPKRKHGRLKTQLFINRNFQTGILENKLTPSVEITKIVKYTMEEIKELITTCNLHPDILVLLSADDPVYLASILAI